jgi:primosomal replication protein N
MVDSVFDFSKLEIPLNICGKASEEFQQKIKQSSSTSVVNAILYPHRSC